MTRLIRAARAARAARAPLLLLLALAPLMARPGLAAACAIDSTASLFADGVRATLTPPTTAPVNINRWAAFSFPQAFAAGRTLQFGESRAELARTLPPAMLNGPYRWTFGDGATALGRAVSHRYARPGTYKLVVSGFDRRSHGWFQFDNALLRVVAPTQVLQANLGYYALRALDVVMSSLLWLFDAALVLLVLFVFVGRSRTRRRGRPGTNRAAGSASAESS